MQPKTIRRGDTVYKAGEPITELYVIQSGVAALTVQRGNTSLEIAQVGLGQLLGEEALWGANTWNTTATANNEVRVLPIDLKEAVGLLRSGSPLIQMFLKGIIEKERTWWEALHAIKTESDPTPCPPERVTQLFAVLYQAATYTGTQKQGKTVIVWPSFKKYCQRVFLESPVRLEAAVQILVKVGAAKLEFIPCETDPDAPDELGFVHFSDLERVKRFYEFYRLVFFGKPAPGQPAPNPDPTSSDIIREIAEWNRTGKVA